MNRTGIRRWSRSRRLCILGLAAWMGCGLFASAAGSKTLLVHLPSVPVEVAGGQAEAITAFVDYLAARVPGQALEAKIFRRLADAQDFLAGQAGDVTLMLADASSPLAQAHGLMPAYRFEHGGKSTYRRLLVVRADRLELEKLVDLQGKTLALVEAAGEGEAAFLEREIFEGGLDPAAWFSGVVPEADDFSATASVLYNKTDAALVAEYNPLLGQHLGQDLKELYASPQLALPVLSIREAAFESADREALSQALAELATDDLGRQALAGLGIDGMRPISTSGRVPEPRRRTKRLSIASATEVDLMLDVPPLPAPESLSFVVTVELPEIPLQSPQP